VRGRTWCTCRMIPWTARVYYCKLPTEDIHNSCCADMRLSIMSVSPITITIMSYMYPMRTRQGGGRADGTFRKSIGGQADAVLLILSLFLSPPDLSFPFFPGRTIIYHTRLKKLLYYISCFTTSSIPHARYSGTFLARLLLHQSTELRLRAPRMAENGNNDAPDSEYTLVHQCPDTPYRRYWFGRRHRLMLYSFTTDNRIERDNPRINPQWARDPRDPRSPP